LTGEKPKYLSHAKRIRNAKQEFLKRMERLRDEDILRDKAG